MATVYGVAGKGEVSAADGLQQLPDTLQRFLVFEQSHLWKPERFRATKREDSFDQRYLPESGAVFRIPCFKVQRRHLYVSGSAKSVGELFQTTGADRHDEEVLVAVHPAELRRYSECLRAMGARSASEDGLHVFGTPTSSTRTVLVWADGKPESSCFVKLSLHAGLLGDRSLPRSKVAGSIGMSELVHRSRGALPADIKYFPEPLGVVPRCMQDGGMIIRCIPEEIVRGGVIAAPLFSLIGHDSSHTALLRQILDAGRVTVREILEEVLLARFARLWLDMAFDFGLILEAHGQDLLLALSRDLVPLGGFYYRDFEGLAVDWALRRARGLPEPDNLPHGFEWFSTYETWGYPLYQLVSMKLWISLTDYIHLVLGELEAALLQWRASGVLSKELFGKGELTFLFSHYLRRAVRDKFGVAEAAEYDIRHQRNRFVKFLMGVRKQIIRS